MDNRNSAKERKLVNDWQYLKPIGPHDDIMENLEEMHESDVRALFEAGDEMAEYISQL